MEFLSNPVVIGCMGVAVLVALLVWVHERTMARQARFFSQLGAGADRVIDYGGRRIKAEYSDATRDEPSRLSLILAVAAPGPWEIAREGGADSLLEKFGLEGKIAVGDPDFDARFHLFSGDARFAAAYFASPRKRAAAAALFSSGCARIELAGDGLTADWSPFEMSDARGRSVKSSLPHLAALAEEMPQSALVFQAPGMSKRQFDKISTVCVLVAAGALLPLALATDGIMPLSSGEMFLASLVFSAPATAAFLLAMRSLLKGKSWFLSSLYRTSFVALLLFVFGGYLAAVSLNAKLDDGAPVMHRAPVLAKHETHGRNSSYYVLIASWRPGREFEKLYLRRDVYEAVRPRLQDAVVTTKPGRFGIEWLTGFHFEPASGAPAR